MDTKMSYGPALTYFLEKLSGVSTNIFRLEAQTGDSATANRILRFSLPSNSLLNLRSFCLHFNASCGGSATGGGRLPAKIDTLIERVEVSVGGVQLSSGCNFYNVLRHAKDALQGDSCDSVLGHPEICRQKSYVNGLGAGAAVLSTTLNESYLPDNKACQFAIDTWEGFLGTCEPKILDSSLFPDMVIAIYLTDNNVLTTSAGVALDGTGLVDITDVGTGSVTYTMNNIHATIECLGLNDSVYDNMVSSTIASKGSLDIGFKQYLSFQDTTANSLRFSLATQSLDRLWVAHRTPAYGTQAAPKRVNGYKKWDTTNSLGGIADYDAGGSLSTNKEKYIGNYYNFVEPSSATKMTYQFSLNGSFYPQFQATWEEMYVISRNSVLGEPQEMMGLDTMKNNYSVQVIRLNLPESEYGRVQSGLDTRGISLNAFYNLYNCSTAATINLFAECSSTLRIGAGKQLEVIQ